MLFVVFCQCIKVCKVGASACTWSDGCKVRKESAVTHRPQQSSTLVCESENGTSIVAISAWSMEKGYNNRKENFQDGRSCQYSLTSVSIAKGGFHESGGMILQIPYRCASGLILRMYSNGSFQSSSVGRYVGAS